LTFSLPPLQNYPSKPNSDTFLHLYTILDIVSQKLFALSVLVCSALVSKVRLLLFLQKKIIHWAEFA
jgi:hypothetical protein